MKKIFLIFVLSLSLLFLPSCEVFEIFVLMDTNDVIFEQKRDNESEEIQTSVDATTNDDVTIGDIAEISTSAFSIHFLELGNKYAGDSILIDCGDTEVLIDAGSRTSSASTIKQYINNYVDDGTIEYVIATHSDQDHISAFVGTNNSGILYSYKVETIIMFDFVKSTTQTCTNFYSAVNYQKETFDTNVYTASQCYDEQNGASRQYFLNAENTLSINILYNYYYYNLSSDNNDHSVVTLLSYTGDSTSHYLFTGDLEKSGESYLVDYYENVPNEYATAYNILPEVELYKAGHHGSKTSSTEKLLAKIKPKNIAVCCCAGSTEYTTNNDNTFPTQTMISNACVYTENIYVTSLAVFDSDGNYSNTSLNGDIVFYYQDELKLYCTNNTTKLKDTEWFQQNRIWS